MLTTGSEAQKIPEFEQTTCSTNSFGDGWTYIDMWCQHYLPCGLCARTDRPCPKYNGQNPWGPKVVWTTYNEAAEKAQRNIINPHINGDHTFTTGELKND